MFDIETVLMPARYEDAAYSAGTLDRPALQRLLKDIDARKSTLLSSTRLTG